MQRNYRGKRTDTKEWVYGYLYVNSNDGRHFILIDGDLTEEYTAEEVIVETVGQCTGLMDESLNDIYQSDIITDGVFNYIIKWIDFGFWKVQIGQCDGVKSMLYNIKYYRKVGTIFDNPELLQEVDNGFNR